MKAFLERNKIFFEIFTSVLLGLMAIIVSYQANLIAKAQLQLANESQQLALKEHLPEIEAKFQRPDPTKGREKEELIISNIGESMYEFQSYEIAYLSIRELQVVYAHQTTTPGVHLKRAMIPLTNYFPTFSYIVNYNKGVIKTLEIENRDTLPSLTTRLEKDYKEIRKSINIEIERFMRTEYKDKFGGEHVDYFKFGVFGESIAIDNEKGMTIFSEYSKMVSNGSFVDYEIPEKSNISHIWENNGI